MPVQLKGKTALIAGAGRNNGKAIALTFAREGAKVLTLLADLSKPEEVNRIVKQNVALFLASDQSSYVTGDRIICAGGKYM